MNEYTIEYWANGQYNYDVKVQASDMKDALLKAPDALKRAGLENVVKREEYQVLYND